MTNRFPKGREIINGDDVEVISIKMLIQKVQQLPRKKASKPLFYAVMGKYSVFIDVIRILSASIHKPIFFTPVRGSTNMFLSLI